MILKSIGRLALQLLIITTLLAATTFTEKELHAESPNLIITIWVHGSKTLPTAVYKLVGFDMPLGLNRADTLIEAHQPKRFIDTLCKNSPLINKDHLYLFGWPGALEPLLRKSEAHRLYSAIEQLLAEYKKNYGCMPSIRIITHSHGGNLALNLARVADEKESHSFIIAELILLACPVWDANKICIDHPLFERVYNLYSNLDIIQCIDPQGRYSASHQLGDTPLFSGRRFDSHAKLIQTEIDCLFPTQHGLFLFRPFLPNLQRIKHLMDQVYDSGKRDTRIKIRWNPFTQWSDVHVV